MAKEKGQYSEIRIRINGDKEALEMYEKIKELLYNTEISYFLHEIDIYGMYSSGFRNNKDK
jgi:hypothetical protein